MKKLSLILFALVAFGQMAWAQTIVSSQSELTSAVGTNNADIQLGADILLSTYLNIDGKTVTIDLHGHTLSRNLDEHNSEGHVIYVHNNATLHLTGTGTITGGKANNGGAINIGPLCTVTANNVTFSGNLAAEHAGAIWNGGTLTATNCSFTSNTANDVGGIYNANVNNTYYGKATLEDCTFTGNSGTNGCGTIGNAAGATSMTITGGSITGGIAGTNGGAIWNSSTLTLNNVTIQNCQALNTGSDQGKGGAILNNGGTLTINGGTFQNNTSLDGGAIHNKSGATLTINSGTFTGNSTTQHGGGAITNQGILNVYGGTFTGNSSFTNGGGIYTNGPLYMHGNPAVSGNIGNTGTSSSTNNLYLADYNGTTRPIIVNGAFTTGAHIGLTPYGASDAMTYQYSNHNNGVDPATIFFSDNNYSIELTTLGVSTEVNQNTSVTVIPASYIDADGHEAYYANCIPLSTLSPDEYTYLSSGWYAMDQDCTFRFRITMTDYADVKIILVDGFTLTASLGITVNNNQFLTIYGQSGQTGQLNASSPSNASFACIGSTYHHNLGHITINGGVIVAQATSSSQAAGIGCGQELSASYTSIAGSITINGGTITASGGDRADGIGGALYNTPESITINGGNIHATGGTNNGIGINASTITLNWTNLTDSYYSGSYKGSVTLAKKFNNEYTILNAGLVGNNGVLGNKTLVPPLSRNTFITAGDWNDATNWNTGTVPGSSDNAYVFAAATITNLVEANNIKIGTDGSITIADGGQLIHNNTGVTATVQKIINPWNVQSGEGITDGWYFIASPITDAYTPAGSMVENTYDLYRLNPTSEKWENFKNTTEHPDFTTLNNGTGYLYANSVQTTLGFTGELKPYSEANGANQVDLGASWNLVGNPFSCNVYASQPFYKMNEARTGLSAQLSTSTAIAPCEGIIVKATQAGNVAFTKDAPQQSAHPGNIQIALAEASNTRGAATALDNAIVSFNEGTELGKFYFGDNAKLYIPQNGKEYAIAYSEKQGEMPLNFKAMKNGTYTISVNPENVEMSYLHLIDNMTGADVDLLTPPACGHPLSEGEGIQPATYTFTAKTTDYESRFKLVFAANGIDADDDEAPFAYYADGEIIITGVGDAFNASLQVVDMLGRQLFSRDIHSAFRIPHSTFPMGVYVLRLISGDDVRTQKIIIQ